MLTFVIAFLFGIATDYVWTQAVRASNGKDAIAAANWNTLLYGCGLFPTFMVVESNWAGMVAFGVGGWLGTFFCLRQEK